MLLYTSGVNGTQTLQLKGRDCWMDKKQGTMMCYLPEMHFECKDTGGLKKMDV